jgi:O-antigen/teichoic acid export membrane protein
LEPAKRLLKNYITLFAGNVLGQLFFFLGFVQLARVLGPSGFGIWNFAQVCMLYLLRLGEFGLEVVGVRETSRDPKIVGSWIAHVVSIRIVLAVFLFGLAMLLSVTNLFPSGTTSLVVISSLCVFPMALLVEWVFEARQEVGLISIARILKGMLFFLGVVFLISKSDDVKLAAYLYVISLTLPAVMMLSIVVSRFGFTWSSLSIRSALDALHKSAPIGVSSLLLQYCLSVSPLMVGYFLSMEKLGYFTAAHRIVLFMWAYILTSMHRILLPSLSQYFRDSLPQYTRFVEKFFRLSALFAVPLGLVGTLCAIPLMTLLFTAQYESSGIVFAIIIWAFVLASIRSILEIALIASDRQRRYMLGMVFLAIMYTVLAPILTLKYGIAGASAAMVISELCYFVYLILFFPFLKPSLLIKNTWKPILAAIISLIIFLPLTDLHPVFKMVFSSATFGIIIIGLKGVTIDDWELLKSIIRRESVKQPVS